MVERDYVMRLIHEIIRTLIALVFGRDVDEETELIPEKKWWKVSVIWRNVMVMEPWRNPFWKM